MIKKLKEVKDLTIFLLQAVLFYILPLAAGPTDSMGLIVLIILFTFVLAIIEGIISNSAIKKFYPLVVSILFIPTIYIYYNDSVYIYIIWYLIESVIGLFIGSLIRGIVRRKIR